MLYIYIWHITYDSRPAEKNNYIRLYDFVKRLYAHLLTRLLLAYKSRRKAVSLTQHVST